MPLSPQLDMGWRARIGVLYPEHGYLDEEFWEFAAPGVAVLMARTRVQPDDTVPSIKRFAADPDNDRTAQGFSRINVNAVAYACTAIGFIRGPSGEEDLLRRMTSAARAPATCTITASIAALRQMGASNIAMATPFNDEINGLLGDFFAHHGISVHNIANISLVGDRDGATVNEVPLEAVYKLAKRANTERAEAVYIPCTALRTLEVLEPLEEDLRKPVISANQATMWHAQRIASVYAPLNERGSLFREISHDEQGSDLAPRPRISLVGQDRSS